jgi:hypothetical protein
MSNISVILNLGTSRIAVRESNFAMLKYTWQGTIHSFTLKNETEVYIRSVRDDDFFGFLLLSNFEKQSIRFKNGETVTEKDWRLGEFKNFAGLEPAQVGDKIKGAFRIVSETSVCKQFYLVNYTGTVPVNFNQIENKDPDSEGFECTVLESNTVAKNFLNQFKDVSFLDLETGLISTENELVAEITNLLKNAGQQTALAFEGFVIEGASTHPFVFYQSQGNYTKQTLLEYKKGLELWLRILKDYKEKIAVLDDREKLFIYMDTLYRYNMLSVISVQAKIEILKTFASGSLSNWYFSFTKWRSVQAETIAINIVESISNTDAAEFLQKLNTTFVIDEKEVVSPEDNTIKINKKYTLYKALFYKIDDFFGEDNFTKFIKKLGKLVLAKHNVTIIEGKKYTLQELNAITTKHFIWGAKDGKNKVSYKEISNDDEKIRFLETVCLKTELIPVTQSNPLGTYTYTTYKEVCKEKQAIEIEAAHFDLVSISFYQNPTFVDLTTDPNYIGQSFITFTGYIDYLIEKEETALTIKIFEVALYAISLLVGFGEFVAAVRTVNYARALIGVLITAGDTSLYLVADTAFRNYLVTEYPNDYETILDIMLIAGLMTSLGGGAVAGEGILNKYSKIEAAEFVGTGKQMLIDARATAQLTTNEKAVLREAVRKFEHALAPIKNDADVIKGILRAKAAVRFYRYAELRSEINLLTQPNKIRFLEDFANIPEYLVINISRNEDFVTHWRNLTNAEKDVVKADVVGYFKNWYYDKVLDIAETLYNSNIWFDIRSGINVKYKLNELQTIVEVGIIRRVSLRPSLINEAGDAIITSGVNAGKSIDVWGVPRVAFEKGTWVTNYTKSKKKLLESINDHFAKIVTPPQGLPPLDEFIMDFRNFEYSPNPNLKNDVLNYINDPLYKYNYLVNTDKLRIINN